jgi:predicted ATPase
VLARDELTKASEWYHTEGYRSYVEQYGYDGGILVYAVLAWTSWILGYPERARDTCTEMLAIAERTANPGAVVSVLAYAANVARECRDLESVLQLTNRIMSFGRAWAAPALCTQGWAIAQGGEVDEGIAKMRQGLSRFQRAGLQGTYDYHRTALVETLLLRGEVEEALPIVRDALARCQTLLDRFHEAELHRLEGELLRRGGDEAGAEAAFRAALEVAGRQSAKSYELRAAMSYGRLLRDQGKRDAARELLGAVHGWFTEGHDTHDLRAAATLLAELR